MNRAGFYISFRLFSLLLVAFSTGTNLFAQKVHTIDILNADLTASDIKISRDARKLIGNVSLRHEDAIMFCDSAYFYPATYTVDAFSNVKIIQGDTLTLTGDKLHYNGITKMAEVRNNVVLVNKETTLVTNYLDYNRETGIGYYLGGGKITDKDNILTSKQGYFYTNVDEFIFKKDVVIEHPDYNILSDTLKYNTTTEIAYFYGPTEIIGEDSYIYCEKGWYDTRVDKSLVTRNAYLIDKSTWLKGDSLYYEGGIGFGRATGNVQLIDSAQNLILSGHYGIYYKETQYAMITDSALMIQVEDADSMYVHADTLKSIQNPDIQEQSRILKAYNRVKFFRSDIQGVCDSLVYIEADSTFHFFGSPVLWSDENQLTAGKIEILMKNKELNEMYMRDNSFIASQEDSTKFNQIMGKMMTGFFKENKLSKVLVSGNGQTIYYGVDNDEIIGVNKTECSDLIIYLKENKISRVNYIANPKGTYYPIHLFSPDEAFLSDFTWNVSWRPLKPSDVFSWK
ncbi:MAG TPA: organic solvent tolerance protein OstA [Bacteroidaceae bacterium]|nr:organic solvent tolerance protein OstA [Bacteroidaceae bacterium]